jgi:hypothetical protein
MLQRLEQCYRQADAIINKPTPYRFAGGHNAQFAPSLSYDHGINAPGAGLDCSSFASIVLRAGGILASPRAQWPLSTAELIRWGQPGEGEFLTVWVRNDAIQEHCFLDFHRHTAFKHQYCEAPHPGLDCRWLAAESFTSFEPRHWAAT